MTLDPNKIAERLGATHVEQIPEAGDGAFGMARLAAMLKERLQPSRVQQRQTTSVRWILSSRVPMSRETENQLILLAEKLSSPEHRIDPMQLAAQLLEETVRKLAQQEP